MDTLRLGGVLAVSAATVIVASATVGYCCCREKPFGIIRRNGGEAELGLQQSDEEDTVLEVALAMVETPPTMSASDTPIKQPLSGQEMRARALYLFPGLLEGDKRVHRCDSRDLEEHVGTLIAMRIKELEQEVGEAGMQRLMKLENAIELCIKLGLNQDVVRRRYEVVNRIKEELELPSKTPTMVTIRHLVKRLSSIDNCFGEERDMDGLIREEYKGQKWLSYMGVQLRRGPSLKQALARVTSELKRCKFDECFMHGTNGDKLIGIFNKHGAMIVSNGLQGGHDFGSGVYCFENNFLGALSFAIDRSWMFNESNPSDLPRHNPAIVVFPSPMQINSTIKKRWWCDVNKRKPYTDRALRYIIADETDRDEFIEKRKRWREKDKKWKEVVKLARVFGKVPKEPEVFHGWLHDCEKTYATDKWHEPIVDPDRWTQHCFAAAVLLGTKRLFIEFCINWNDWTNEGSANLELDKEMIGESKRRIEKDILALQGKLY